MALAPNPVSRFKSQWVLGNAWADEVAKEAAQLMRPKPSLRLDVWDSRLILLEVAEISGKVLGAWPFPNQLFGKLEK